MAAMALCLGSCKDYYQTANGQKVRLTPVNDEIIRVEAVPSDASFSGKASLIVEPAALKGNFSTKPVVTEADGTVSVKTARLEARLDLASGTVSFYDAQGQLLSAEDHREFTPFQADGTSAYSVRQVFESTPDEGFYGLGQHQADEWDYKGRNEELYQYNTKISIPFVVSSKNYGILWDSYSFCRWGDPRDYLQLGEVFKLYDADGVEGALSGTYTDAKGGRMLRRETALAQEFLETPACEVVRNAPRDFNFQGSKVLYEGSLEPQESGLFHFYLYYAGYTKVFVDGKQVMPEIWRTAWNPNGRKFQVQLQQGVKVPLRIEWEPDGSVSYCGLRVLSPVDPAEQAKMSWWGEMQDQIDYYFIAGENMDRVISGYRTLTGKAPIMPKWVMGYWQSRERYTSQDQIVGTLQEFRRRNIPIDNIVQDWQYWKDDQWGSHEFDESRFPDPKKMVEDIHAMNGRFMISVWPKFYFGTEHFNELDSKGWIYRTAIDERVVDWLGYVQSFYDAYSADARKLFWKQMYDHLYPLDIDAWWMDASEPNIHDCTDMDYRKKMAGPTALGPAAQYFNAYALMNAEAIYNGQRSVDPDRRVFLLTRNGFAGLQKYSTASWSGDIGTRWEDMKAQISAGLNYSLSGIPFWGQDIGGFSVENRFAAAQHLFDATGKVNADLKEWREMNVRWHQWGVFCPLYRAHGQFPLREPWNIAPDGDLSQQLIVAVDQSRYRLMPYIYTLAARVYFDDYTIMRPLVMDFTADAKARSISDQFLFGDAIMVCPVYEYGARSRSVYLPDGGWYDLNNGRAFIQGGCTITAPAPYEYIPLYARDGQIIVSGDLVQSTAEPQQTLYVDVYGLKDASFGLYEDEGLNYNYEKGACATIPMHWDAAGRSLCIGAREGSYPGMIQERDLVVTLYRGNDAPLCKTVHYDGTETVVEF
ncbi:MAG: DUF5110 domain-containing protein [Bacteroidales bacterium]|nr:DUF5110 domain-containing protein [Bacteroidales bacterium]